MSFCHGNELQGMGERFPIEFLRSANCLPLCVPITYSLMALLKECEGDVNREDDTFQPNTPKDDTQWLKAAGMDILRFISQLSDMYNDSDFKDRNKSLSSILSQPRLNMEMLFNLYYKLRCDVMCEIRHQLTHKQYPSAQVVRSGIQYLLAYVRQNFWEPLKSAQPLKIAKKIKKSFKTGNVSKTSFVVYSRAYVVQ